MTKESRLAELLARKYVLEVEILKLKTLKPNNFNVKPIQRIVITRFDGGGFTIDHKHIQFTEDSYYADSKNGLLAAVKNLINDLQPDIGDLYWKEGEKRPGGWLKQKPLD